MKEEVYNLFSIEKGSAFLKGSLSILLMLNFLPNLEVIALLGKVIMSFGGAVMLGVSIFQGLLNIGKTKSETHGQKLANRQRVLQNRKIEIETELLERQLRLHHFGLPQKPIYDADSIESDESENDPKNEI